MIKQMIYFIKVTRRENRRNSVFVVVTVLGVTGLPSHLRTVLTSLILDETPPNLPCITLDHRRFLTCKIIEIWLLLLLF